MPLPPRDDPRRVIALAVNAARVMGAVTLSMAALVGGGAALLVLSGDKGMVFAIALIAGAAASLLGVYGALYFVFAGHLKRYKPWAAIVLLVMASLQSAVLGTGAMKNLAGFVSGNPPPLLPFLFGVLFFAVGVLLVVYLSKSIKVLKYIPGDRVSAFEPIMPPGQPGMWGSVPPPGAASPPLPVRPGTSRDGTPSW